jgi:hypothetical protein
VVADFEAADYGAWQIAGDAFGKAPARGTLPGQMAVDGFAGKGLVNSFVGGDKSMGTLTSPPFELKRTFSLEAASVCSPEAAGWKARAPHCRVADFTRKIVTFPSPACLVFRTPAGEIQFHAPENSRRG